MKQVRPIVLASASPSRRRLLENAGLHIETAPAAIDEAALRDEMTVQGAVDPGDIAGRLAEAKAAEVAHRYPDRAVIGADQVLVCDGRRFDKASDMQAARSQLRALQGRRHELIAAAVLYIDNEMIWSYRESARLAMRPLSAADIDDYLGTVGPEVLGSVGCYHLEGRGAWLFERVEGDFFTILGLPLLALLETLRRAGILD